MSRNTLMLGLTLGLIWAVPPTSAVAYTVCGVHDGTFPLVAYHSHSESWVDQLEEQANAWNRVHPVLKIERDQSAKVPLGGDGQSIVTWLAEDDLKEHYHVDWSDAVAWTFTWRGSEVCQARILETDVVFNPAIRIFAPQRTLPYELAFPEIALHELGHVLGHEHEDEVLAVMTSKEAVSNVLYASDKVGWLRAAEARLSVLDPPDMGVFPLERNGAGLQFARVLAEPGKVTVSHLTIQNLSARQDVDDAAFRVVLQPKGTGNNLEIGKFSWSDFPAYSEWSGSLEFNVSDEVAAGEYQLIVEFQGSDGDSSNNQAVLGKVVISAAMTPGP